MRVTDIAVSLGDGIRVDTSGVGTIVFDARNPNGDVNVVSHAHTDHLPRKGGHSTIVCSDLTARLGAERRGLDDLRPTTHPAIELLPAGHIDGSRAALVDDGGRRILFTGDVCTRDRPGLPGFEPVPADVLIVEATYGKPEYRFPPVDDVADRMTEWIEEIEDKPVILFGYALGRAQRILRVLESRLTEPVKITEDIARLNQLIAEDTGDPFRTQRFDPERGLHPGEILLTPTSGSRSGPIRDLIRSGEAVTAGCTGWAVERSYQYRRSVDRGFVLSDHCDFDELVALVENVDPNVVYTHHGFARELSRELTRLGYDARALKKHQSTLDSFE